MLGQRFRINAPTIATVFQDCKKVAIQIPAGAEILAIDSVPDPVADRNQTGECQMGRQDCHDVCG